MEGACPGCEAIQARRLFGGHRVLRCETCGRWWKVEVDRKCGQPPSGRWKKNACHTTHPRFTPARMSDGSDGACCYSCGVRSPLRAIQGRRPEFTRKIAPGRLPSADARARIVAAIDMAIAGEVEMTSNEANQLHHGLRALLDRVYAVRPNEVAATLK